MKKWILVSLLWLAIIGMVIGAGVMLHSTSKTVLDDVASSTPIAATSTDTFPTEDDVERERKWTDDYDYGADEHRLIASAEDHAYYCKIHYGYEGPTACYLFLERNGVYTPTRLKAEDVDTTLLTSPDKRYLAIINPYSVVLIRVADDMRKEWYKASPSEILGYSGNSDFRAKAAWDGNTTLEIQVYNSEHNIPDIGDKPTRILKLTI